MKTPSITRCIAVCAGISFCLIQIQLSAQSTAFTAVDSAVLQNPARGEWLHWRGGQNAWGYSELDQINVDNVSQMQLVWSWAMDDTGAGETAPLVPAEFSSRLGQAGEAT